MRRTPLGEMTNGFAISFMSEIAARLEYGWLGSYSASCVRSLGLWLLV